MRIYPLETDLEKALFKEIQDEIKADQIEINLQDDIYCISFLAFMKGDSAKDLDRLVLKCLFTFTFQSMIVGLLMTQYLNVDTSGDSFSIGSFF